MGLHFKFDYGDIDKLISYSSDHFSMEELYSICRLLELNKNDIFTQYVPKRINCENLVDAIKQKEYFNHLLLILQTEKYYRSSLFDMFPKLQLNKPTTKEQLRTLGQLVYSDFESEKYPDSEEWIRNCKRKMVLILGKDSPDEYLDKLSNICEFVKQQGYEPILIKRKEEVNTISNEEKMLVYASLSRFVIIEKSYAAGQIDEAKICAINRFPMIWLMKDGHGDTWMQGDYEVDFKYIKSYKYNDENLDDKIHEGIQWVENFISDKEEYLNDAYPWRE